MKKWFETSIRTRYSETDQGGIIHHASYAVYLEIARIEFFKTLGYEINALEKKKIFCPVVTLSLHYLKPLRSQEDIIIQIALESFSKVRFCLAYQVIRDTEKIATASIVQCFLNEKFKPIPIPADLLERAQFWCVDQI